VRTADFFEPALHQSAQHQMHGPALLSQNANQLGDALIIAGTRRIRYRITDDRDLSARWSRGRLGGGHRRFRAAGDCAFPRRARDQSNLLDLGRPDLNLRKIMSRLSSCAIIHMNGTLPDIAQSTRISNSAMPPVCCDGSRESSPVSTSRLTPLPPPS
jgi:hypothetical protein